MSTRSTPTRARLRRTAALATVAAVAAGTPVAVSASAASSCASSCTVASDGSGDFSSVQDALDAVPADNDSRVTITLEPGTYREQVEVNKPKVSLIGGGDDADDVRIVDGVSAGQAGGHRGSATVVVLASDFMADNLTVENDFEETGSKEGEQALALYLNGDRTVLDDMDILGDQDTLLVNDDARAYVTDSYIEGTVDFIYGNGVAVFHRDTIYEKRQEGGPVTAARTPADSKYGLMFFRSKITGATDGTTQLGRPWGPDAQVLYRECDLSATIDTDQPWIDMSGNDWQGARFLEYENTGPGATVNSNRAQLSDDDADDYTPEKYLAGDDGWAPVQRSEDNS